MILFYDTCSLLTSLDSAFKSNKFYISSITINELENIKNSSIKSEETKYNARKLLHLLEKNEDKYEIITYKPKFLRKIRKFGLPDTPDSKIIATANWLFKKKKGGVFYTKDLACRAIAKSIGLEVHFLAEKQEEEYTGFKKVTVTEEMLAHFFEKEHIENDNVFGLLENQYLLLILHNEIVAKYKWRDNKYYDIPFKKAESKMFGKVVPFNNDTYQALALDSLASNQITMLRGRAGSGKSYLAFGHMFSLLEQGKIDKIIVFCNTVAAKGAAKLGFYPGSRTEKLLDSQIGNLLESKLGDRIAVEKLIDEGQLVLLPIADIRGYDTSGMNAAVYISEAQNLDIELMRLALQRIGDDSICIIDGDFAHQVDMSQYAGDANGMRRVSQVFRNHNFYGEVELQYIHRSKIAEIAELL